MSDDQDCVQVGDDIAWLEPTSELRFVQREGKNILQQKWAASGAKRGYGSSVTETKWRWKDVPLDLNPERDCA